MLKVFAGRLTANMLLYCSDLATEWLETKQ